MLHVRGNGRVTTRAIQEPWPLVYCFVNANALKSGLHLHRWLRVLNGITLLLAVLVVLAEGAVGFNLGASHMIGNLFQCAHYSVRGTGLLFLVGVMVALGGLVGCIATIAYIIDG